ncbi:hypothetical protein [Nocardia sp. NBC_01009]|uniref:hypothetical protein n=1 Tax=Nocardia sp. NBC_01009 TaxID=2975996 RepID=UPI00386E81B3|nr:hypothetical protein OHA42_06290 [Nocardia sp. NBC_01009]
MQHEPQHSLYTTARDHQVVVLHKTPIVAYPFGRPEPEASASDSAATDEAPAKNRASVEDPRVTHGRIGVPAPVAAIDSREQNERDAPADTDSISALLRDGDKANSTQAPASEAEHDPNLAVEPIPESLALAHVRKHINSHDAGTSKASSGRLAAERFSVGWMVYTPAIGRQRDNEIYYVTDDGELEETSAATDPATYMKSVKQRFRQRRALFG